MPLDISELNAIKANLGVDSRRLMELYNDHRGSDASDDLFEAATKADASYQAVKTIVEKLES